MSPRADYSFCRDILYVRFPGFPFSELSLTNSRPFKRWNLLPIGGRSTAIKLKSGDVWVLASTPLCNETRSKLNQMGPVKYETYFCHTEYPHPLLLGG